MDPTDARATAAAWLYSEHFGFVKAPPLSDPEVVRNMALALVAVAAGDGKLSDAERRWIVGYFAAKGYPQTVLDEVTAIPAPKPRPVANLMDLGILRASRRILVYDAIRAASADGYDPSEKRVVLEVAGALGLDEAAVAQIEALVDEERALKLKRIDVLMPDGHPNLAPR